MKLLTRNQYMKQFNVGYEKLQKMIANKEVDYLPTADRVRIDENTVSIEMYNTLYEKYIKERTENQMIRNILLERR